MEIEDHAQRSSEELPKLVAGYTTKASYPATRARTQPRAGRADRRQQLGTKVIYVEHGSFDTHVSQKATQDQLLAQFSDAVGAFYDDLAAHGNDRRVLTMTFSEFGRRIEENGSRGTDHGEASPLFLIGGGVKGGLYGTLPDLGATQHGQRALHGRLPQRLRDGARALARAVRPPRVLGGDFSTASRAC